MAMFSKPGMFGRGPAWNTPPIASAAPPVSSGLDAASHRGGWGDAAIGALGGLADGILQGSGMAPVYAPMVAQRRARQQQVEDYERQRRDSLDIWTAQQQYKAAHPDTPDIVDRMRALDTVEQGLGATYARNYANNGGALPQMMNVPGVGLVQVPRAPAAPSAPAGPPVGTVKGGYRFKGGNPNDPTAWEPAGGAPSQGGATFP